MLALGKSIEVLLIVRQTIGFMFLKKLVVAGRVELAIPTGYENFQVLFSVFDIIHKSQFSQLPIF
jgi:hypothetical protein